MHAKGVTQKLYQLLLLLVDKELNETAVCFYLFCMDHDCVSVCNNGFPAAGRESRRPPKVAKHLVYHRYLVSGDPFPTGFPRAKKSSRPCSRAL